MEHSWKPAVSILMAVHNGEPYLSAAIDSLLRQTFTDFELVIVDDGSTDESLATVRKFESADDRIKSLCNNQNLGLVGSLNKGLAICRAELVARADADDIFSPDRIAIQLNFMNLHPEVGVLGSAVEFIDQHGSPINRSLHSFPTGPPDINLHSLLGCCLWHTTVMFRKALVEEAGRYSMDFNGGPEDYDLWARMLNRTCIANYPAPLAKQRLHSKSITAGWDVGFSMYCAVAQRLLERYLGRVVRHSEATALVSMCGCDGDLAHIDSSEGFRVLREVLIEAAKKEDKQVLKQFRNRCSRALLRQAGFVVYKQRKLSWQLMRQGCQTSSQMVFSSNLWSNLARLMLPSIARNLWKRI